MCCPWVWKSITHRFHIPASDHLRPILNRKILNVVLPRLRFFSIGSTKYGLNLCANSNELFLSRPLLCRKRLLLRHVCMKVDGFQLTVYGWPIKNIKGRHSGHERRLFGGHDPVYKNYVHSLDSPVRGNDETAVFLILDGFIKTDFHFSLRPRGHGVSDCKTLYRKMRRKAIYIHYI